MGYQNGNRTKNAGAANKIAEFPQPRLQAAMSDQAASRFTPQNQTTQERLSTHTVGLVALSDFRKRRAEVLEQQEREDRKSVV